LEVFKKYFPQATVYANRGNREPHQTDSAKKLNVWGAQMGDELRKISCCPSSKGSGIDLRDKNWNYWIRRVFSAYIYLDTFDQSRVGGSMFLEILSMLDGGRHGITEKDARKNWFASTG